VQRRSRFSFSCSVQLTDKELFQQPVTLDPLIPVVGHGKRFVVGDEAANGGVTVGMVGIVGAGPTIGGTLRVGTAAAELTPRLPISVEPNGSPVRAAPPGAVGDVKVGVEEDAMLLEPEPHIPERPEVSSTPELEVLDAVGVPDVDIPDVDIPVTLMPADVAAVAGAAVPVVIPPPS
jgi:hypothetical protein